MLGVTKKEIVHFMTVEGFQWREDASNLSTAYKRNAIRLDLVPVLAGLAGSQEALHKYELLPLLSPLLCVEYISCSDCFSFDLAGALRRLALRVFS